MAQMNNDSAKTWSAPVLEELTIDLSAIAAKNQPGNDGSGGKTKS
ncbi:hypothetical protein GGQ88_001351 [Novosphingobium hassiacum]|uniref:Uncharacterized protein n=1 Tax=Novosphingobium hassiacum TaxID=173676 RepID=A0A7W6EVM4_9SPHN|nr:hypothetical protein [Novosphingobium hassiacum]MBB3860090.1 hypothetical protein [Novosphingobium hassiacum]